MNDGNTWFYVKLTLIWRFSGMIPVENGNTGTVYSPFDFGVTSALNVYIFPLLTVLL